MKDTRSTKKRIKELEAAIEARDLRIGKLDREMRQLVDRDWRGIGRKVVQDFWSVHAGRVAAIALREGRTFTLHPPTEDDYKRATESLVATLATTHLEIAR